ncbi:alpha/beta hydrolase family protein [Haloplasma contractile]|uniref:Prolyl oligopeptidase family protein n=1 Tax=Haloplasma contractile SSD-17B TaxID=1033810 RepID=F7PRM9_9MOLU|nr:prolyl oligopeptidase family serine peptidase [Haloplasma contractile]ERJ11891.1 Putative prolyl oligopeptidase family protein [Haloplasma contractile SSD-17B]
MKNNGYVTMKQMIDLPEYHSVELNKDGSKCAFVKEIADWDRNIYESQIWVYSKELNYMESITTDSESPKWSPDGNRLAYLKKINAKSQICIYDTKENKHVQVTNLNEGITYFRWNNTGSGFFLLTNIPVSNSIINRKREYGDFMIEDKEHSLNTLGFIKSHLDLKKDSDVKTIVEFKDQYINGFECSRDGLQLVLTTTPTPLLKDQYKKELYIYNLKEQQVKKLSIRGRLLSTPIFSPGGQMICYITTKKEKSYYEYHKHDRTLEMFDLMTNTVIKPLKSDLFLTSIKWSEAGILIEWIEKMNYKIGILNQLGQVNSLGNDHEDESITHPSITTDGTHVAYLLSNRDQISELVIDDKTITTCSKIFSNKQVSNKELVSWSNVDGLMLEGVLIKPHDFDCSKKYPLLVVGGGASLTPTNSKWWPIEQFIEKGFLVFEPNKRGYPGYGDEFLNGDYQKLGIAYYEDIISGVDLLIEKGFIDSTRVGIMGFSEAGYTAIFASLYSDRFKAVSALAASNNWETFYSSSEISYLAKQLLGGTPWDDEALYQKLSTLTYLKSANAPTLILHQENEPIEPLIVAKELYRGLRDLNIDTELVIFKGCNHYSGEPKQDLAIMKLNLKWFLHYLLNEPMNDIRDVFEEDESV